MEEIFELIPDQQNWEVKIRNKQFFHSAHQFCQICASKMRFKIVDHEPKFSGYTGNLQYDVTEVCPNGCESFVAQTIYRNQFDGKLYINNFIEIEEYKDHLLQKESKWTKNLH